MDRDQFIAQVKTQQNALRSFLLALCGGNLADADDIAQESLIKAYLAIDRYTDSGKFKSWLFKIAHNTFLNHTAALKQVRFHRSRRNRCDPGIRRPQFRASATLSRALHPTPERARRHNALLPQRLLHQGNRGHNRGQCRCRKKAIIPGPGQTQTTHQAMTKDKELENLFATAIQEFNDNDLSTADLSSRLDKVEILKHIQQEQKRRSYTRLLVAFFAGALSVIVALLLLPMLPTDMEIIRNLTSLSDIAFFSHKVKVLSSIILFVLTYSVVFSAYSIYSTLSAEKTGKPSK